MASHFTKPTSFDRCYSISEFPRKVRRFGSGKQFYISRSFSTWPKRLHKWLWNGERLFLFSKDIGKPIVYYRLPKVVLTFESILNACLFSKRNLYSELSRASIYVFDFYLSTLHPIKLVKSLTFTYTSHKIFTKFDTIFTKVRHNGTQWWSDSLLSFFFLKTTDYLDENFFFFVVLLKFF